MTQYEDMLTGEFVFRVSRFEMATSKHSSSYSLAETLFQKAYRAAIVDVLWLAAVGAEFSSAFYSIKQPSALRGSSLNALAMLGDKRAEAYL